MKTAVIALVAVALCCLGWIFLRSVEVHTTEVTLSVPAAPVKQPIKTVAPAPTPVAVAPTSPAPAVKVTMPADANAPAAPQIGLADVLGPNNHYHDEQFGVTATLPEGWKARDAALRWGRNNGENTLWMTPDPPTSVSPSMYYQNYPTENRPDTTSSEAYFRGLAEYKENSRINGGLADYKNVPDSFEFTEINGNPAMTYFATFTRGDQVMTEHFIRVLGPNGYVMFFTMGKLEDVKTIMPQLKQMAASVKAP